MDSGRTLPVTHIITGLGTGGAEMMLYKLLKTLDLQKYPSKVISLTGIGDIGSLIKGLGVPVSVMGLKPGGFSKSDIDSLVLEIKKEMPAVVQTWMYHSDLLGGLAANRAGVKSIAWNIRNSTLDWRKSKPTTLITVGLCALLSHFIPQRIAVCSQAASLVHQRIGYSSRKMMVIPNGFDLTVFNPDQKDANGIRKQLSLSQKALVIGLAARFDEQKDHKTFFKSAKIILEKLPDVHFLLCGEGITAENQLIRQWVSAAGPENNFHLLGRQMDMVPFHTACTVAVSSSAYGESFSNVLGEAMACGVPCVSTRVGGAEEVLGETGRLVTPGNSEKLAEAILDILELPEEKLVELGRLSRHRIIENFDISQIAKIYSHFWEELSGRI
jgi:glycosyltransferase involved in cell wall biosynthesis